MTRKEIIDGLKFTVDMFLFDPVTGEEYKEPRNDMDKTTIDACKGAIELLEQTDGNLISKQAVIDTFYKYPNISWTTLDILEKINSIPSVIPKTELNGDLISREDVLNIIDAEKWEYIDYVTEDIGGNVDPHIRCYTENIRDRLSDLPAIPQTDYENYEAFGWCKGCKEYDTEKHCCHRYSSFIRESLQENINAVLEDIKAEIDKLPRIKVGNSNSPTVKYCIDERLLYEILEKMKGE